jgi:enterobacterial common antigen flippase
MFRAIFSIGFLQVVSVAIGAVRTKVFAVLLGPSGFGVLATIDQLVLSVSQFCNFGLPDTAVKFISRSHSISEEQFQKSYAGFIKAIISLGLVATLILLIYLPSNLARIDPQLGKYRTPVSIALLGIPATMLLVFLVHVLAARQKAIESVLLITISAAVFALFGIVGCFLAGISGVYLAVVPGSTALVAAIIIYARTKLGWRLHVPAQPNDRGIKINREIVGTAMANYIAVSCYSGFLLLARYLSITNLSEEAAGLLQAGLAVALSIGAILGPTNLLYLAPYLNRVMPVETKVQSVDKFLPRLILLYCLGALPILLFPELTLRILFSGRFIDAVGVLRILLIWQCFFQIAGIYQQLLIGLDDVKAYCLITSAGYAGAAALCLWLVGTLGLNGIAIAFTVSALFIAVSAALHLRLKYKYTLPRSLYLFGLLAVLTLIGTVALGHWTREITLIGLATRLIFAVSFVVGLWFILPKTLRSELFGSAIAQLRTLLGRKSPELP